jgi:hypothetical protein
MSGIYCTFQKRCITILWFYPFGFHGEIVLLGWWIRREKFTLHPSPPPKKKTFKYAVTKIQKQLFSEMKLLGLVPNFYIHVTVNDLPVYIPTISPQTQFSKIDGHIVEINKSLTDTWMQTLGTRPRSFLSGNICFEFSVPCLPPPTYEERNICNICKSKWSKNTALCCIYRKIFDWLVVWWWGELIFGLNEWYPPTGLKYVWKTMMAYNHCLPPPYLSEMVNFAIF